ncbi:hypothetical protein A2U01_0110587, partial [Trifolium medium]|nr:hypothetical protein [Trifolium medium]
DLLEEDFVKAEEDEKRRQEEEKKKKQEEELRILSEIESSGKIVENKGKAVVVDHDPLLL